MSGTEQIKFFIYDALGHLIIHDSTIIMCQKTVDKAS